MEAGSLLHLKQAKNNFKHYCEELIFFNSQQNNYNDKNF